MHASRRVPRVFGFASNWYLGATSFCPNTFVSVDESDWQLKLSALACYVSEYQRAGKIWVEYIEHQSRNYGAQLAVARAEAFITYKNLWEICV